MTRRVAVIGDLAGHLEELFAELVRLGADPDSGRLPADLTVVQLGDLVHRGPDSPGVIEFVDELLRAQPEQWIQLAGNHEAQYLIDPLFSWPETLPKASADLLRGWWADGRMRAAAAVATQAGDWLVTHAGLTRGFWAELGAPPTAEASAAAVNELIRTADRRLHRPGCMLGDVPCSDAAGPLWASAGYELLPSWRGHAAPFSQVHGHSSVFDWHRGGPRGDLTATVVDPRRRHTTTTLSNGRVIVGIDPGHGQRPALPWAPLVLVTA